MDFVKREDPNILDEESYKVYIDSFQKTHQMDMSDYHTPISIEQLHQAMQSSLNASSIVHNFQLSPRQMSTLMLKSNHLSRSLNFTDLPSHLPRNLTSDMDLVHNLANDLPQNHRHDDLLLNSNLARNLEMRNLNDLELQASLTQTLVQNLNEQELARNMTVEMGRINDVIPQNIGRSDAHLPHDLGHEIDLSHHLNRQNIEQDVMMNQEGRRTPLIQSIQDGHILEQNLVQRLDQRLDQTLGHRMEHKMDLNLHETSQRHTEQEHLLPMPFHIKSEQEDDGYFYESINHGINNNAINGHLSLHQEHTSANAASLPQDQLHYYNNQLPISALNSIDHLYSRPQNYVQNYGTNISRDNPQNLVVHRQFNNSPYPDEFKKPIEDGDVGGKIDSSKNEEPKENLKPTDQNKMFYTEYNQNTYTNNTDKNENESNTNNKLFDEVSMNIKGEYACFKCNEVFPCKRGLRQHVKTCVENGEMNDLVEKLGKFCCTQCSYRCQSPAILKIHERTHTGEKPYSCTFCDYKSGQKNNVAKHILVHMKEKPFRCQYCDYRCAQKNNLVVHERTHTGYKPFACPYCDYRTVQKPNLVKHMYLHTDQKPFSCDMCSYRCVQKTNLTKHKQRHMNDKEGDKVEIKGQVKPYRPRQKSVKCPHCAYRCVQKSSLEKHLQFKHNELSIEFVPEYKQGVNSKCDDICDDTIQNLSVKKDDPVYVENVCQDKAMEPLKIQS
ncbi:Gastrula zinc finger protein XlCGF57.1 [Papilio xuthus]|uniref:Gastrula zinc finger protein XlCGF57.1 n=1 Tax=Papilio xuthus TaxID=66420 RepID=A0A194PYT0_PAPXU|nr:Gastrula zinc finger protein XlCGF57.1 [Papilio xuthus]